MSYNIYLMSDSEIDDGLPQLLPGTIWSRERKTRVGNIQHLKNANTLPTWRETYTAEQWKEHIQLLAERAFSKQINFTTMTQEEYDAIQAHNK